MPKLNSSIFREYDIRGREGEDLSDKVMYFLGKGFGTYLRRKNISSCVSGHDARATSESYQKNFIKGLLECGVNVVDIGTCATPMGYWAQYHFNIPGVAMITASHNPVGWNGAKLGDDFTKTISGSEIQEINNIISTDNFENGQGSLKEENIFDDYTKDLINRVGTLKKFKILVNTGNGTASILTPKLLRQAGAEVVEHNTNIDPTYPNYTPNPENRKMMEDTALQTIQNKCDLGVAFDGDGDRLGMVDEKGNIIPADVILILLSRLYLASHPNAKVMFDVKVTEALPEDIIKHGGVPVMYKTGHSLIKAKMKQDRINLTGEMSGHIFLGKDLNYYGFDDASYACLKVLEYLSNQDQPLSEIINQIPHYISTPMINVKAPDTEKHQIVQNLVEQFKENGLKVVDIDGARVYTDDGWGLVRASNTTPYLVLRFESKTEKGLENLKNLFKQKMAQIPDLNQEWEETH